MSCEYCKKLPRTIRLPKDLSEAISSLRVNLECENLEYLGNGAFGEPFTNFSCGVGWGDIVNNYFKCSHCSQLLHLRAETYHGQGGQLSFIEQVSESLTSQEPPHNKPMQRGTFKSWLASLRSLF
ncbi:hypothetical protein [Pseudoalteromonas rubra]|uniref:hypothetical protein n=1 Tax=Pseudoalteromonas rubra TaxID=43658 RepID=UPI00197E1F99|nr:hypothetical protein [Pseudoalteromonas rubra]